MSFSYDDKYRWLDSYYIFIIFFIITHKVHIKTFYFFLWIYV